MNLYRIIAMVAVMVVLYFINRVTAKNVFRDYYKEKRSKYPWLDKWINDRRIKPDKVRAIEALNNSLIVFGGLYFGITLVLGWILNFICRLIVEKALGIIIMPDELMYTLYTNIGTAIAIIIAVIASLTISRETVKDTTGINTKDFLTLECPSCGCPHSWVMISFQNVVAGGDSITTTTTTKTINAENAYGGGAIGQMFAGPSSKTETSETTVYYGYELRCYECLNCGHTDKSERSKKWKNKKPSQYLHEYNPPQDSWVVAKGIKARFSSLAIFAVMFIMVVYAAFYNDRFVKKTAEIPENQLSKNIDVSLNGIIKSRYASVKVWSEQSTVNDALFTIPAGEFFAIISKSGKFTLVEYKGRQGYVTSQSVKKLHKNRTAKVNRNTYVGKEPTAAHQGATIDNSSTYFFKGILVTLLGVNENGFVKVNSNGEIYWFKSGELDW